VPRTVALQVKKGQPKKAAKPGHTLGVQARCESPLSHHAFAGPAWQGASRRGFLWSRCQWSEKEGPKASPGTAALDTPPSAHSPLYQPFAARGPSPGAATSAGASTLGDMLMLTELAMGEQRCGPHLQLLVTLGTRLRALDQHPRMAPLQGRRTPAVRRGSPSHCLRSRSGSSGLASAKGRAAPGAPSPAHTLLSRLLPFASLKWNSMRLFPFLPEPACKSQPFLQSVRDMCCFLSLTAAFPLIRCCCHDVVLSPTPFPRERANAMGVALSKLDRWLHVISTKRKGRPDTGVPRTEGTPWVHRGTPQRRGLSSGCPRPKGRGSEGQFAREQEAAHAWERPKGMCCALL